MGRQDEREAESLARQIEALLDAGESLLWWDKLSGKAIMGGVGGTLALITLAVNAAILLLIIAPPLLPGLDAVSWLLLPLLIVDCICLFFILLYFAFGMMTGGVNAITDRRVLLADLHGNKIRRCLRLDSLSAIKARRGRGGRGDIVFLRDAGRSQAASAKNPRRLVMSDLRHLERVLDLLRQLGAPLDDN